MSSELKLTLDMVDNATPKFKKGQKEQQKAVEKTGKAGKDAGKKISDGQKKATDATKKANQAFAKLDDVVKGIGIAAVAAFGVQMVRSMKDAIGQTLELQDQLAKLSKRVGVNVEAIQAYQFAATKAGTSVEAVTNAIRTLNKMQADAIDGSTSAMLAFEKLEITLEDLQTLGPEEMFQRVSDELLGIASHAERSQIAMILLSEAGAELLPMLDTIASAAEQAEHFGIANAEAAEQAERLADSSADLSAAWEGLKLQSISDGFFDIAAGERAVAEGMVLLRKGGGFKGILQDLGLFGGGGLSGLIGAVVTTGVRGARAPAPAPPRPSTDIGPSGLEDMGLVPEDAAWSVPRPTRRLGATGLQMEELFEPEEDPFTDAELGLEDVDEMINVAITDMERLGEVAQSALVTGINSGAAALGDWVAGLSTAEDLLASLEGIWRNIISEIAAAIIKQQIYNALVAMTGGAAGPLGFLLRSQGGMVPGYAQGGVVYAANGFSSGPKGTDTIPAFLTPGEGVLTRSAVAGIGGAGAVNALNATNGRSMGGVSINIGGGTFVGPGGAREFAANLHAELLDLIRTNDYEGLAV